MKLNEGVKFKCWSQAHGYLIEIQNKNQSFSVSRGENTRSRQAWARLQNNNLS